MTHTSTMALPQNQIVVVEDDDDSRRALTNVLQDEGYRVASFSSGEAALDYLRSTSPAPQLIVLDLMMPGMKGWSFRHEQKHDPDLAAIPVVTVSALGKLVDVDVALQKPVDYDELMKAVERYVARRGGPGQTARR
jgi:CheY-like chemotaxis protein